MASIWQITLSGYDAQAASESGQSATGKIALGTWGSYGHETIQVTLAEPWDVCTLVTLSFSFQSFLPEAQKVYHSTLPVL